MKTHHPRPPMTVPISLETYQQLLVASGQTGFDKEDWEIAAIAIREWMARNSPDVFNLPEAAGYQWKRVFLPNGTLLRTVFNGKNHHCRVEHDSIMYNGETISPSGFANAVGGTNRNAWKVIWLLFPNEQSWKLAEDVRPKSRHSIRATSR